MIIIKLFEEVKPCPNWGFFVLFIFDMFVYLSRYRYVELTHFFIKKNYE